ncbi:MAG TPA: lysylphosphatidylglycerol synthase transmembrane domain-containing protein [Candidatus Deferrimicrobium sp.]|nr:lysylphosphatidylglycerol synthase transmembrane domain-containing protein [Candidatus Deferrimicrobium sp.]
MEPQALPSESAMSTQGAPPVTAGRPRRRTMRQRIFSRRRIPLVLALAVIGSLIVASNPSQVGTAIERFHISDIPIIVGLSVGYYILQGVRWWTLLRIVTTKPPLGETVLMTLTGQATALLPLGELTRAILLARVRDIAVGSAVAAVTVQELLYSALLISAALPGSSRYYFARAGVAAALGGTVLVVVLLTVRPVYQLLRRGVARLPVLQRMMGSIDRLQSDTVILFENWRTYVWLWISAVQAVMAISLFYFVVNAIAPGRLDWVTAAFIYSISNVASAITLSPGSLGAFEATTAGLLVATGGLPFGVATAAAVVHRLADKGLSAVLGVSLYAYVRAHHRLRGISLFDLRDTQSIPPPLADDH